MKTLVIDVTKKISAESAASIREQIIYLDNNITAVSLEDNQIKVSLNKEIDDHEPLKQKIEYLISNTILSFSKVKYQTVHENKWRGEKQYENPMPYLLKTEQAIETVKGGYVLQGDLLDVLMKLDKIFRDYAINTGCKEQLYPLTVPLRSMSENGYLSSFPHHAKLVSLVHRDLDDIKELALLQKESPVQETMLSAPEEMLAPTVCYHCFESLRNKSFQAKSNLYTGINKCSRDEANNIDGLSRLNTFTMREIIFFGNAKEVETRKQQILQYCMDLFESWNVAFKVITATDPFFPIKSQSKRYYQTIKALKHELRMYLPFNDADIACASFNNHQDSLVAPYNISLIDDGLQSGCAGFGYERIAFALFSQFGARLQEWPESLRSDLAL